MMGHPYIITETIPKCHLEAEILQKIDDGVSSSGYILALSNAN
jgi:hypothetical protein